MNDKINCCCCTRQIVSDGRSDDLVCPAPVTLMGINQYCCAECGEDLDENGLFPEERADVEETFNTGG